MVPTSHLSAQQSRCPPLLLHSVCQRSTFLANLMSQVSCVRKQVDYNHLATACYQIYVQEFVDGQAHIAALHHDLKSDAHAAAQLVIAIGI